MAQDSDALPTAVQVVLPAPDLDDSIGFFRDQLGFRLEMIFPADAPRVAIMSGAEMTIRLDKGLRPTGEAPIDSLEVLKALASEQIHGASAPRIDLATPDDPVDIPPLRPAQTLMPPADRSDWSTGRAGMQYRDLIPGRLGGAVIASHIRIPEGGPVPDYVHHHHVRFQLIYCLRGWVRLVYEDQGSPFVMQAGDCVLQPPHIRHQVLECSDGFEVVEVGCPAEHQTLVDHAMTLPTARHRPTRDFSGQRFVWHQAAETPWIVDGSLEVRDSGISVASGGAVNVRACRTVAGDDIAFRQSRPFYFGFVLEGSGRLRAGTEPFEAIPNASYVIPPGVDCKFDALSADFSWLEVTADLDAANP